MFRLHETLLFDVYEGIELYSLRIISWVLFSIDTFLQVYNIFQTFGGQLSTKVAQM